MPEIEQWYKQIVDTDDELTGFKSGTCFCGEEGYHLECQEGMRPAIDDNKKAIDYLESLGYQTVDVTNSDLKNAERSIIKYLKLDPFESGYKSEDVLENGDTYYFPICWIGCCGHLVAKDDHKITTFGSYVGHIEHIWAYYEGVQFASLGKDRKNNLTIKTVSDRTNTIKVLKSFLDSRYVTNKIEPQFDSLPIVLESIDIYFGIKDLFKARMNNWFEFEVE
jgi:hypothetical protein